MSAAGTGSRGGPRRTLIWSIGIAAVILIPYPTTVCPTWKLQVVDESGRPFAKAGVVQIWRYYSMEETDHQEMRCTNQAGLVEFPRRTFVASFLKRGMGAALELREMGRNASIGASAFVIVGAPGYDNHGAHYWRGKPPGIVKLTKRAPESMFPYRERCD